MLSSRLIRAYRFFRTHGLQVVGERTIYALKYARAELLAKDAGCTWEWTDDFDGWVELSTNDFLCSCGCGHKIERCEGCIMRDADGIISSVLAFYTAAAMVINSVNRRVIVPLGAPMM